MIFLCVSPWANAQSKNYSNIFKDIPGLVERLLLEWKVPGLAIGVVKGEEVIFLQGFGYRDVEKKLKVNEKTLFNIGSCTKAFTSLSAAMLVDQGKLDWDTPVIEYLPVFRLSDDYATLHTTPRDLLRHTTGLGRHDEMWKKSPYTRKEIIERLRYLEPAGGFRDGHRYSNLMVTTAGYLVGQLTGGTWEQFVSQKILKPLDMNRTKFSIRQSESDKNFAFPYGHDGTKFNKVWYHVMDEIAPAGGIVSSVEDMCKWLSLHINKGKIGQKQLVSEKQIRETHRPQVVMWSFGKNKEEPFGAYCLGWAYSLYQGYESVWHDGGTRGYQAVVFMIPGQKIGIAALSNTSGHYLDYAVINTIVDRLLGLEAIDWTKRYAPSARTSNRNREKPKEKIDIARWQQFISKEEIALLVGSYEHTAYGPLTVRLKNGKPLLTFNTNECELEYAGFGNFKVTSGWYRGTRIIVNCDLPGNIKSLVFHSPRRGMDNIEFLRSRSEAADKR
jgi:CubicO group peptidase (beta-lactamase class C family)